MNEAVRIARNIANDVAGLALPPPLSEAERRLVELEKDLLYQRTRTSWPSYVLKRLDGGSLLVLDTAQHGFEYGLFLPLTRAQALALLEDRP